MEEKRIKAEASMTGAELKALAAAAMLVDHVGAVFLKEAVSYRLFRAVGRIAFPLYCFLLVEGFLHSKDRRGYGQRLLSFALLSEIPFDLAFWGKPVEAYYQNVYFTLLLGVCMMGFLNRFKESPFKQSCVLALSFLAAEAVRCDYGGTGLLLIAAFYYRRLGLLGWMPAVLITFWESLSCLGSGALSLVFACRYNGDRGSIRHKYFWYWFYPLHLLALYFILCLLKGR